MGRRTPVVMAAATQVGLFQNWVPSGIWVRHCRACTIVSVSWNTRYSESTYQGQHEAPVLDDLVDTQHAECRLTLFNRRCAGGTEKRRGGSDQGGEKHSRKS